MSKVQLTKRESSAKDHGANLYYVKVPQSISKEYEILIYADRMTVGEDGTLFFITKDNKNEIENVTLVLSPENWKFAYEASENGQYPVSVSRWKGVAEIRVIEKEPEIIKEVELPLVQEVTIEEKQEIEQEVDTTINSEEKVE
jgi:hypothetical protein